MHRLPLTVLLSVVVLALSFTPVWGQEYGVLDDVANFRALRFSDGLQWDRCSVYEALGRPDGFPAELRPRLQAVLTEGDEPCPPIEYMDQFRRVRVMSIIESPTEAEVHLRVTQGDRGWDEVYALEHALSWFIVEVRISNFMQGRIPLPPTNPTP